VKGEGKAKYVALPLDLFCRNFTEEKADLPVFRGNRVWQKCVAVLCSNFMWGTIFGKQLKLCRDIKRLM